MCLSKDELGLAHVDHTTKKLNKKRARTELEQGIKNERLEKENIEEQSEIDYAFLRIDKI